MARFTPYLLRTPDRQVDHTPEWRSLTAQLERALHRIYGQHLCNSPWQRGS